MLFGVPDEITDVTRVSGMVRKRRLIYRMTSFDYRKVFGVTGNVPGMTNGFREFTGGATHPGEAHRTWRRHTSPYWAGGTSHKCPMRQGEENQERKKKKEEVGRKGDSLPPNLVQLGLGGGESPPPWTRPTPLGLLEPQGKVPSLPPIYTEVWGLI